MNFYYVGWPITKSFSTRNCNIYIRVYITNNNCYFANLNLFWSIYFLTMDSSQHLIPETDSKDNSLESGKTRKFSKYNPTRNLGTGSLNSASSIRADTMPLDISPKEVAKRSLNKKRVNGTSLKQKLNKTRTQTPEIKPVEVYNEEVRCVICKKCKKIINTSNLKNDTYSLCKTCDEDYYSDVSPDAF